MSTAAGLIFSNIHDQSMPEMTRRRTMASIPYGCRYRLVDFALSNMVNANITNIGMITHYNYQSLLDHIGNGKDWDLARRSGGIKILPPYIAAYENSVAGKLYENRLEALIGSINFVNRCNADYMVLSDCDTIMNIDLKDVLNTHIESGAFMTIVTKTVNPEKVHFDEDVIQLRTDADGKVTDALYQKPKGRSAKICTNIYVIRRSDLQAIANDAIAHGYKSFEHDVLPKYIKKKEIRAYEFEGYYANISSLESYFKHSMELLQEEPRHDLLFNPDRQIYTKVRNSAPTKYMDGANVKNSLIADGCVIEGTVENSILFRGVHVGKDCVVKNSILLQDTYMGSSVSLNCVITDKNVVIKDGRTLSGHETMPFFIDKGITV